MNVAKNQHELLVMIDEGSMLSFTKLYNQYLTLVHQFIAKFLNFERAAIEEVAQNVFLKI